MIVATTSSALFDLSVENKIFLEQGEKAYSDYQINNENTPLAPGYAYNLITKLLRLNALGLGDIVEVILLSRNSGDSGLRVMKSIAHYGLAIERAAFSCGENPHLYAKAFNASIFLSANPSDVTAALASGTPAALIGVVSRNPRKFRRPPRRSTGKLFDALGQTPERFVHIFQSLGFYALRA